MILVAMTITITVTPSMTILQYHLDCFVLVLQDVSSMSFANHAESADCKDHQSEDPTCRN